MTTESQIVEFLYAHRGCLFCYPCIRRCLTLPDLREIEDALVAIGNAAHFKIADAHCSECDTQRVVVGVR